MDRERRLARSSTSLARLPPARFRVSLPLLPHPHPRPRSCLCFHPGSSSPSKPQKALPSLSSLCAPKLPRSQIGPSHVRCSSLLAPLQRCSWTLTRPSFGQLRISRRALWTCAARRVTPAPSSSLGSLTPPPRQPEAKRTSEKGDHKVGAEVAIPHVELPLRRSWRREVRVHRAGWWIEETRIRTVDSSRRLV